MLVFFGTKAVQRPLPPVQKVCPNCLSVTEHAVVEHDTRFTVYFIPLFSVSRTVTYTCGSCGDSHSVDYAEYRAAHPDAQPVPDDPFGGAAAPAGQPAAPPNHVRDKARAILEGKVVGDQIHTTPPLAQRLAPDSLLRWLYIGFGVVALISVTLLILILFIISR